MAIAGKPQDASISALPTSQALGIRKMASAVCNCWNRRPRWIWLIMAILVAEVGGGYFSRYRAYGQSRPDTASTCRKACALLSGEVCHTPMYFLPFLRFGRAPHFSTITSACTDSSVSKNGSRCLRGCFRQRVRISSGRFKTGLPGKRSATPMWPCQPRVVPDLFTYSPKRSR